MLRGEIDRRLLEGIHHIEADALAHKGMTTTGVDHLSLGVLHVVVLEEVLTDAVVILLHLLLSILDSIAELLGDKHIVILESHGGEHLRHTIRAEEAHQLILQRDKEDGRPGVPLTSCTTTQLAVDTTGLVSLSTDDSETARSLHLGGELDIGTTTGHIGRNGYRTGLPRLGDDVCLLLEELCIEHIVRDMSQVEHPTE